MRRRKQLGGKHPKRKQKAKALGWNKQGGPESKQMEVRMCRAEEKGRRERTRKRCAWARL